MVDLKYISFFCFLFLSILTYSQNKIHGIIKDENGHPIAHALIKIDQKNPKYSTANIDGYYELFCPEKDSIILVFSSMSFKTKVVSMTIDKADTELHVVMEEDAFTLDDVFIQAEKPIEERKDTVRIKTRFFADGLESNVGDLLNKLPGVTVDDAGTIKINGAEIDKLLVDGDDLFDKGYRILSMNMPAYPIEEVEILNSYSPNRLLKNIEHSNRVAINLKLDDKYKRIWFGNLSATLGNDSYHELKGNLMNFGKKNKYYLLASSNNIGNNLTGDIAHLIRPSSSGTSGDIGDNQRLTNLIRLTPSKPRFDERRNTFNHARLLSFNAIFNPNKNLQIKPIIFFNHDKVDFFRNNITTVNTSGANFTNTEEYKVENKKNIAFGKLDINYTLNDLETLESSTRYNRGQFDDGADLIFNGTSTLESLEHQNKLIDQKINYTNKIGDQRALLLTGRFINEKQPQKYHINQFFFEDLFPELEQADNVLQEINNSMQYMGFNAYLLDRRKNEDLFELQVGNEYRKDKLDSDLSFLNKKDLLDKPMAYQNEMNYQVNDLYLKSSYRHKIRNIVLSGKLNVHQLFNKLENQGVNTQQNSFYVHPTISFEWEINNKNSLVSNYSYTTTNAKTLDLYSNYVLTNYNTFTKGTGDFNQLTASSFFINYKFGNWSDRFFANAFINYGKNHDFYSSSSLIQQNYTQSEKIMIKDRQSLLLNMSLDYYLKDLKTNIKIDLSTNISEYKNVVNEELRKIDSQNYTYGLTLRSSFTGFFNYYIGTKWKTNVIKTNHRLSNTNHVTFLDLFFNISDTLDIQVQSEQYYFGGLETDKSYYFLDFGINYILIKNKLNLGVTGKNIFNTEKFRDYTITDINTSITEYRLLPRLVLLSLEFRF